MRATPKRFIKTLFMCSIMGFLIVNMNLFLRAGLDDYTEEEYSDIGSDAVVRHTPGVEIPGLVPQRTLSSNSSSHGVNSVYLNSSVHKDTQNVPPPARADVPHAVPHANGYIRVGEDVQARKDYIAKVNREQHIRNLGRFDLSVSENTVVIVVQVHNRDEYLRYLIDSLRKARYIEESLLVFSHDFFSDDINTIIWDIDFCPVMQIFYPHSIQLHPHEFPGEDPGDCPRDATKDKAMKLNCKNKDWPDKYGHYREAKYTQTKHHWFWKIARVFDNLHVTKNYNGPVLFIEEDHYLTPDFIHALWKMYRFKDQSCKDCSIFTLGTYDKNPTYGILSQKGFWHRLFGGKEEEVNVDAVEIMPWISSKHNMGMSMNREIWKKIQACTENFCKFDDYNWDWSLQYISMTCTPERLKVMVMKSPRIYHIGECGVHHKGKNCDPRNRVSHIETLLVNNKQYLFPDTLSVHGYPRAPSRVPKPNGGWGDYRDHKMCMGFAGKEGKR